MFTIRWGRLRYWKRMTHMRNGSRLPLRGFAGRLESYVRTIRIHNMQLPIS